MTLEKQNRAMARLVQAVQELSMARRLNEIMAVVRRTARELTGADGATFVLREGDQCYYADEEAISPLWKGQRFPMSACISGWTMLHCEPAVIEDIYSDDRVPAAAYRLTFVKSLTMVPIRTEAPIGAIGTYWATRRMPTADEVQLLQALANSTSVAMENVGLYASLEQRVQERTRQLEAANKELEAFSYSVSHDLRAPLRRVLAFSELLLESAADRLELKEKHYLDRLRSEGKGMGRLIDDLLRLAQLARSPVQHVEVDLSRLAAQIVAQLKAVAQPPFPEVTIQENLSAFGDPGLLQVVLENLLSNAWKFSSKNPQPKIEFGSVTQPDGTMAFYVRDNGVGFDMRYASKLFSPFQRLHSTQEFPGSGIGLATVQRIIHKHDGRIWTESAVGNGATFLFNVSPLPG